MQEPNPKLVSCKPLKPEFQEFKKINITGEDFRIGRGVNNSVIIPNISISRLHCQIKKVGENLWNLEDKSRCGIEVNGDKIGCGKSRILHNNDILRFDPSNEFVYKFICNTSADFNNCESLVKRIKLENENQSDYVRNELVEKIKFENGDQSDYERNELENKMKLENGDHWEKSRNDEIKNIPQKVKLNKTLQTPLQVLSQDAFPNDINQNVKHSGNSFQLSGEINELNQQKTLSVDKSNVENTNIMKMMKSQITELMKQIVINNTKEDELRKEIKKLEEKLVNEKEALVAENSREILLKQNYIDQLEGKIRELEEIKLEERKKYEDLLKNKTEELILAKERAINEVDERCKQTVDELKETIDELRKEIQDKEMHNLQCHSKIEMINNEMDKMIKLRQMTVKLFEEQLASAESEKRRETEQANQTIYSLQDQLEIATTTLRMTEERYDQLEVKYKELEQNNTKKVQEALEKIGDLMDTELQCSICGEVFVDATTLNCSHTFCKYCITMWKMKKRECPNCRAAITSEIKSIVFDTYIEKMTRSLTEEMKKKRDELVKMREENANNMPDPSSLRNNSGSSFSSSSSERSRFESDSDSDDDDDDDGDDGTVEVYLEDALEYIANSDNGTEEPQELPEGRSFGRSFYNRSNGETALRALGSRLPPAASDALDSGEELRPARHHTEPEPHAPRPPGRRAPLVPGLPGHFYGGYGHCYRCGARGHWAPGCPTRTAVDAAVFNVNLNFNFFPS